MTTDGRCGAARSLGAAALRDPVLRALVAVEVVIAAVLIAMPTAGAEVVTYWFLVPVLDLLLIGTVVRVVRVPDLTPPARRFWRIFRLSSVLYLIGDSTQAVQTALDPVPGQAAGGLIGNTLTAVGLCLVIWAMLTYPTGATGKERTRLWLDSATVMIAATAVTAYAMLGNESDHPVGSQLVTLVFVSTLMLVGSFAILKLLIGGAAPFTRASGSVAVVSEILLGISQAVPESVLESRHLGLVLVLRTVTMAMFAMLPRLVELETRLDPDVLVRRKPRPYSRLPYAAVAGTQALLVIDIVLDADRDLQLYVLLAGVVLATTVVTVRQLMAFKDNARLLDQLGRHERRFRSLVQHSGDIIAVTDANLIYTYISPAVERIVGIPADLIVGSSAGAWSETADHGGLTAGLERLRATPGESMEFELRVDRPNGSVIWLHSVVTNLLDEPSVRGIVFNSRDVTQARELTERLRHQASHDTLTHLANRSLLTERIEGALGTGDRPVAICLVDLDNFKQVNDSYGHHVGDQLLIAVAERLRGCVRAGDTVARLGGDEFAVLLPDTTATMAANIVDRIMWRFGTPVLIEGRPFTIEASVGLATGDLDDPSALLKAADAAMYSVKRTGKGGYEHTMVAS